MKLARLVVERDPGDVSVLRTLLLGITASTLLLAVHSSRAQSDHGPKRGQETEADRVVQSTELQNRLEQEREERIGEHFRVCDLDENGWISFREATAILGISRKEFRRYDTDLDGDIDAEEFRARARTLLGLLGALPSPKRSEGSKDAPSDARTKEARPPVFTVERLLKRFDADASGSLSLEELRKLFDLSKADLSPELVTEQMDPNDSDELEANELGPIATLLTEMRLVLPPTAELADNPNTKSRPFEELYKRNRDEERPTGALGTAPKIAGPVSHFRRLDLWNDGYIDESDLRQLILPARIEVRVAAILSALDADGDNRLSQEEFRTALTDRR